MRQRAIGLYLWVFVLQFLPPPPIYKHLLNLTFRANFPLPGLKDLLTAVLELPYHEQLSMVNCSGTTSLSISGMLKNGVNGFFLFWAFLFETFSKFTPPPPVLPPANPDETVHPLANETIPRPQPEGAPIAQGWDTLSAPAPIPGEWENSPAAAPHPVGALIPEGVPIPGELEAAVGEDDARGRGLLQRICHFQDCTYVFYPLLCMYISTLALYCYDIFKLQIKWLLFIYVFYDKCSPKHEPQMTI